MDAQDHYHGNAHRRHFHDLNHAGQVTAIKDMANTGFSDYAISHATGWAVEGVREAIRSREITGTETTK